MDVAGVGMPDGSLCAPNGVIQMELARRSDPGDENGRRFDARRAGGLDFHRGSRVWMALRVGAWTKANRLVINGWKGG